MIGYIQKYSWYVKLSFSTIIGGCIFITYFFAFSFLNYSEQPVKVDTVILFVGPDYQSRLNEAQYLMNEGYSKHLFVPALNKSFIFENGSLKVDKSHRKDMFKVGSYPDYFENTHIEVLEAKKMMEISGFTSAIFVSSSYHMRRIKIIVSKVFFGKNYILSFKSSRFDKPNSLFSNVKWSNIKRFFFEYIKIVAFCFYRIF